MPRGNANNAINKAVANAARATKLPPSAKKMQQSKYPDEKAYQASFGKMSKFAATFSEAEKREYNYIIYHKDNDDGYVAAYLYWKFITNDGQNRTRTDLIIDSMPGRNFAGTTVVNTVARSLAKYRGKNVLILDIAFNRATLDAIAGVANKLLVIDDHPDITRNKNKNKANGGKFVVFVDKDHCAAASVHKFLWPKMNVSTLVQYIDNSDSKLFMGHLPMDSYFKIAFSIRYTKNMKTKHKLNLVYGGVFEEVSDVFKDGNAMTLIFIGKYMNDARENIKSEISSNISYCKFFNYDAAILNFDSPALSKVVSRDAITILRARGYPVDICVLWAYHHSTNRYRIQIMDDHVQTKFSLAKIGQEFVKKFGRLATLESGGHGRIFNMYLQEKDANGNPMLPTVLREAVVPMNTQRTQRGPPREQRRNNKLIM